MRISMLAVLLIGAAGAALAQDRFGETDSRYDFNRVDGALQVGIATDLVPLCTWRAGGWVCTSEQKSRASQAKPDEHDEQEIARLENEVAALKRQLAAAGDSRLTPPPPLAPRAATDDRITVEPPRQGVIARVSDCLAATWRRVVDMIVGVLG